jgi:hypothetical protein
MRPIADLNHSAYDTLEFVKQHYPEMVQMYETIMAHLKVPEAAPAASEPTVITDAFEPEPYMIKGKFDSIIIDPAIITELGYTSDDYNIIAKRSGFVYLGLYNHTYQKEIRIDGFSTGEYEDITVQAPQFALVASKYHGYSSYSESICAIPRAHSLETVFFGVDTGCSSDWTGEGDQNIYDFVTQITGDTWRADYETHYNNYDNYSIVSGYTAHHWIKHDAPEIQFNTLIGLGDNIKLPEVM